MRPTLVHASGREYEVMGVTWESEDPRVVTISPEGMLSLVGPGESTVTGSHKGFVASTQIVVLDGIVGLEMSHSAVVLTLGQDNSLRLEARHVTATGVRLPVENLEWHSGYPNVAKVDADGVVTPLRPGISRITATSARHATHALITVRDGSLAN